MIKKSPQLILLFILFISCSEKGKRDTSEDDFGINNRYASLFDIKYSGETATLKIRNPWQGASNVIHSYLIVPDSVEYKNNNDSSGIIRTPLKRVVTLSTTHLAMIDELGKSSSIYGLSGTDYVVNSEIAERISTGEIKEVGYDNNLNCELIASLEPDLVFVYGVGNESAGYISKLVEVNIPVIFIPDYLEINPLARAEWIKVFGLLYCLEYEADMYFNLIIEKYEALKVYIEDNINERPVVLAGLPYRDTWFVSPGNSYISNLINDAGADYLWNDTESEISMPMSLESVFSRAIESDFWINIGSVESVEQMISLDSRFADLPPMHEGRLFNNNARLNDRGGNDYWESGILHPEVILEDLASIFHPDLFPGYNLQYYKRIEKLQ